MHELSIATEIISIVEKEIENRKLNELAEIKLKVGALSGVDPEALSFVFEMASSGTSLSRTILNIEWLPVKGVCKACNRNFQIDDYAFLCPSCDSAEIEIIQGEELDIVCLIEK